MRSTFKKQMFVQAKNNLDSATSSNNPKSFIDPATYMSNGDFVFTIPPEAPVFEPTVEEFLDPLAYINKIRPIAEKTGICKVKPPPEWHPPFAVDVDHFKFTPRIQKLNELDANTRVKLYFLDRLATYWNYTGMQIRIPAIDDKTVDMYSLYKLVELEGGFDKVNADKRWVRIAARMGYVNEKAVAPQLRTHYKRILLPYEKFEKMKLLSEAGEGNSKTNSEIINSNSSTTTTGIDIENNKIKLEPRENGKCSGTSNSVRRCTRSTCDENDTEILVSDTFKNPVIADKNKELQRLTFYGPGPKILGLNKSKSTSHRRGGSGGGDQKQDDTELDLLADSVCMVCGKGDSEEQILLCDDCDDGYHTYCLTPALNAIPKGEWRCPKCIAAVVSKASDTTFGFEQAAREYSLQQFGEMADQFKSNYFNMPVHMVPTEKVEQEYWKILSSMDSSVTVEYGADLHSMDHGSGFPTQMALKQSGEENHYYKSYVESSWNLNNIPVLEGSVLGYINADISGMKIPWMYVGMCFSTFCWHNEDHWSYSINYLHWGEPKTWYGVPGFMAEQFEQVMQETTPDLFRNQPDLLHQLVTILNPNILMDRGVPVYHIDQAAGEFVLTFPRAYHAGFNHGYNFAEAVNFCPVDWIPLGRECVEHYSSLHRYCVFSHDELICKMASVPENLNSKLASAAHLDMLKMLEVENKQRKALLEWGVVNAEREAFELLADDERKCAECNTTCFLSAVTCKCSPKKVTCLRHFKDHCTCLPIEHTLRYRYTLDELPLMLEKLKEKSDSVAAWAAKVQDALDINTPRTITLSGLKELLNEAREKHFPDDVSLKMLSKAIKSVQDALAVDFKNILSHKQTLNKKVTLDEIRSYYDELRRIPCVLPQENTVKQFLKFLEEFQEDAERALKDDSATANDVETVLKHGHFPNVDIPKVETLKHRARLLRLQEDYRTKTADAKTLLTAEAIDQLLSCCRTITNPESELVEEIMHKLLGLKEQIGEWEAKAKCHLIESNNTCTSTETTIEMLLQEADRIAAVLPSYEKLRSLLQRVALWKQRASSILAPKKSSSFGEYIDRLIDEGESSGFELHDLGKLKLISSKVAQWRNEAYSLFIGDFKAFSLLEVLMPRRNFQQNYRPKDADVTSFVSEEKKWSSWTEFADLFTPSTREANVKEDVDLDKIIASVKVAEKREFELMRALRVKNIYKKKQADGTFCICRSTSALTMKECTLCKDLYHEQCLRRLANYCDEKKLNSRIYLCPFCQRSKRPSSKRVYDLLIKLQRLRIRTIESVAMQCLLDRETKWKESVNELLNTPELSALSRFTTDQKMRPNRTTTPITLSDENKNSLETLLFRGFLLELDLPENEIIYKIMHKLESHVALATGSQEATQSNTVPPNYVGDFDPENMDRELSHETNSLKNELLTTSNGDRKRKMLTYDENGVQIMRTMRGRLIGSPKQNAQQPDHTTSTIKKKPRKMVSRPANMKRSQLARNSVSRLYSAVDRTSNDVQKIQNGANARPRRYNGYTNEGVIDLNDQTEENDDIREQEEEEMECDAKNCLKPSGEHVDWVQCDYCKNWLHMMCIGVKKGEVDDETEFMCNLCKDSDFSKTKDDDDDGEDDDVVFVEYAASSTALCSS